MSNPYGEKFTTVDSEHLADIIWWIKGFQAGCEADLKLCPFDSAHIEALRKARILLNAPTDEEVGHYV